MVRSIAPERAIHCSDARCNKRNVAIPHREFATGLGGGPALYGEVVERGAEGGSIRAIHAVDMLITGSCHFICDDRFSDFLRSVFSEEDSLSPR